MLEGVKKWSNSCRLSVSRQRRTRSPMLLAPCGQYTLSASDAARIARAGRKNPGATVG